jgi:diadenosine tetraphosphate (Ap4A) HIT family hydrolase
VTLPLPQTPSCYFCEIVAGERAPWNVIGRDEWTVTVLNGRQFEIGQCMVVPLRHAPTLLDLSAAEDAAIMAAAKRLTRILVDAFAPDGVLLYQNNGVGSGQEVPHFHLHVVPRRAGSDWGLGPPHIARLQQSTRPAHLDHAVVTDAKLQIVERLRRCY